MEQTKKELVTLELVHSSMDQACTRLDGILQRFAPMLDAGADANSWTPRQVLSHIVGALQRVPIQSAFFLTRQPEIPIAVNDPFWLPEWENAPLEAFKFAIQTAYKGQKIFLQTLSQEDLACTSNTPFGEMTLGEFLVLSYNHVGHLHALQLEEFQP